MTEKEKLKIEFILEFVLYLCLRRFPIFQFLYAYICHLLWLCQRERQRQGVVFALVMSGFKYGWLTPDYACPAM